MLGLGALEMIFAKQSSQAADDTYLKTSWILSPAAVLATALDKPVTAIVGALVRWAVPTQWTSGLSAPPILGVRSQNGAEWCAGAAVLLLFGGCIVIAFAQSSDHQDAALRGYMMTRARLMATSWLLVVAAAQLGSLRELGVSIQATTRHWMPSGLSVLAASGVVVVFLVVAVIALQRSEGLRLAGRALCGLACVPMLGFGRFFGALVIASSMAAVGFVLWPAAYVIKASTWMLSLTPEPITRAHTRATEEVALARGAEIVPLTSGPA